jgi:hypothetical protein
VTWELKLVITKNKLFKELEKELIDKGDSLCKGPEVISCFIEEVFLATT